jgi:hypothetical protein
MMKKDTDGLGSLYVFFLCFARVGIKQRNGEMEPKEEVGKAASTSGSYLVRSRVCPRERNRREKWEDQLVLVD